MRAGVEVGASHGVHARAVTLRHGGTVELTTLVAHAAAAGLSAAHVDEHASQRNALSVEDVRAAAERRLDPKDRCIVVVGDADEIVNGIEALGLGAVDVARAAR